MVGYVIYTHTRMRAYMMDNYNIYGLLCDGVCLCLPLLLTKLTAAGPAASHEVSPPAQQSGFLQQYNRNHKEETNNNWYFRIQRES